VQLVEIGSPIVSEQLIAAKIDTEALGLVAVGQAFNQPVGDTFIERVWSQNHLALLAVEGIW